MTDDKKQPEPKPRTASFRGRLGEEGDDLGTRAAGTRERKKRGAEGDDPYNRPERKRH